MALCSHIGWHREDRENEVRLPPPPAHFFPNYPSLRLQPTQFNLPFTAFVVVESEPRSGCDSEGRGAGAGKEACLRAVRLDFHLDALIEDSDFFVEDLSLKGDPDFAFQWLRAEERAGWRFTPPHRRPLPSTTLPTITR